MKTRPTLVAIFLACLVLGCVISITLGGNRFPAPVTAAADLNGNGMDERYTLQGGRVTVIEGDRLCWRSPSSWLVEALLPGDVDNDGRPELALSLWKEGSYGLRRPFWETAPDRSYKNHLFVMHWSEKGLIPKWCSSNLDRPIITMEPADVNADGANELMITEGDYRHVRDEIYTLDDTHPRSTIWSWSGWGFAASSPKMGQKL